MVVVVVVVVEEEACGGSETVGGLCSVIDVNFNSPEVCLHVPYSRRFRLIFRHPRSITCSEVWLHVVHSCCLVAIVAMLTPFFDAVQGYAFVVLTIRVPYIKIFHFCMD